MSDPPSHEDDRPRLTIPSAKPHLDEDVHEAVLEVLRSGHLIQGPWVERLEDGFAKLHGAKHAIATNNGSSALTAALLAHGIGAGDEVILPSFSFFATASSVLGVGARPVFADVSKETFNLSVESAKEAITERTRAILPVHLFGHPAEPHKFQSLCHEHGLVLIEDAAQAHLAAEAGKHVGTFGTGCFSFYPSKNMTTGEGGMVLTNDSELAERLRMIRSQGMRVRYVHETLGSNFRMPDLCAAVGVPQLKHLPAWTARRIEIACYYSQNLPFLITPTTRPSCAHVFHQYTARTPSPLDRDTLVARLRARGIDCRVYYKQAIHQQPVMKQLGFKSAPLPVTEELTRTVFSLPIHPQLTARELEYVVDEVNLACRDMS